MSDGAADRENPVNPADRLPENLAGRSRTEQVAENLLDRIRRGDLPVGTRLPSEQMLAGQYGVSRTVVREAIARLRSDGVVEGGQGRRAFVRQAAPTRLQETGMPSPRTVSALLGFLEVRRGIEAEMAALAASRRTVASVRHLSQALAAVEQAARNGEDGVAEDLNFHLAIGEGTGNAYWNHFVRLFAGGIKAAIRLTRANEARTETFVRAVTDEHRQIFEAIAAGDAARARAAAATHLSNAAARILAADEAFWLQEGQRLAEDWAEIGLLPDRPPT
jgi:DNA-binding FadR family transcriptional regulator